jgi:hypothetical protein
MDGASERTNQKVEQYLRLWVPEQQERWADYLSMAEFVYNSWPQDVTGQSAHELLFGFQPHCTIDNNPTPVPAVEDRLTHLRRARALAQEILNAPQREPTAKFTVGQKVWLEGRNIKTFTPAVSWRPSVMAPS